MNTKNHLNYPVLPALCEYFDLIIMSLFEFIEKENIFRQKEFKFFWLNDNIHEIYRQRDLEIEFGKKSSFLFHFVGFGDRIRMDRRKLFPNQFRRSNSISDIIFILFEISGT